MGRGTILQFSLLPLHPHLGRGLGRRPSHQSQRSAQLPLGQDRKDDGPVTPGVNQNQCIKIGGQAQTSILERGMPAAQASRQWTLTTPHSSPAPSQDAERDLWCQGGDTARSKLAGLAKGPGALPRSAWFSSTRGLVGTIEGYSSPDGNVTLVLSHSIDTGGLGGAGLGSRSALAHGTCTRDTSSGDPGRLPRVCGEERPQAPACLPALGTQAQPRWTHVGGTAGGVRCRGEVQGHEAAMLPAPSPPASPVTQSLSAVLCLDGREAGPAVPLANT